MVTIPTTCGQSWSRNLWLGLVMAQLCDASAPPARPNPLAYYVMSWKTVQSASSSVRPGHSAARTYRVRRVLLLLGALLCTSASSESFSSRDDLKVAVDKVVDGSWTGKNISLWDVSRVTSM